MIPARDEAAGIGNAIDCVTASKGIQLELLILDDHSTDRTAEIVQAKAEQDSRIRLICSKELPAGWCGKQHACWQLANAAANNEFVFLDADVRIQSDAIQRVIAKRHEDASDPTPLLGGFPCQITGTIGERLLIPLINYVLLCYLPFWAMRGSIRLSASAGCGQFFVTGREEYFRAGGHAAIRESLHDGVMLPREYRKSGMTTDVFDASDIAEVRMYDGFKATWNGLAKNAVEGVANPRLIGPVSMLMAGAHLVPVLILIGAIFFPVGRTVIALNVAAIFFSLVPRIAIAVRFDGSLTGVVLHPISIALFLLIQWSAFIGHLIGRQPTWRGRTYSPTENG